MTLRLVLWKFLSDDSDELIYQAPLILLGHLLPIGSDVVEVNVLRPDVLLVAEETNQVVRFGTLTQILAVFVVVASGIKS